MSFRKEILNSLLRKEVGKIMMKEMDFGKTLVTVTQAKVSNDLSEAKILITVFPESEEKNALFELQKNIYHLQKILNKRVKMKKVPKISFEIDQGMKNLYKIDKIKHEI
jgi:ribosome-binding factor A